MQCSAPQPSRYTYLDLLRGFAAFAILIVHYRWFYAVTPFDWSSSSLHALPLSSVLQALYDRGGLAVQLFWILSGVIFTIKYNRHDDLDVWKFWVWRFARLYPLHICTLLLMALLQIVSAVATGSDTVYGNNDPYHFMLQLLFASNWGLEYGPSFNAPVWSISVEIIAYAVFCAYVMFFQRYPFIKALIVLASGAVYFSSGNVIAMCVSLFFIGGIVASLYQLACTGRPWKHARIVAVAGGAAIMLTAVTGVMVGSRIPDKAFYFVLFPSVLLLVLELDHSARPVPTRFEWFGATTYSTYLMHMPILIIMKLWINAQPARLAILASPLMLAAYLGSVIGISIFVHRHFEIPAQNAIQRWYRIRANAPPAQARQGVLAGHVEPGPL